jgi:hypothetical protein
MCLYLYTNRNLIIRSSHISEIDIKNCINLKDGQVHCNHIRSRMYIKGIYILALSTSEHSVFGVMIEPSVFYMVHLLF